VLAAEQISDGPLLHGFVDDDWANDPTRRTLHTGFVLMRGGAVMSWESRKKGEWQNSALRLNM